MADTTRVTVPEAIEALKHCVENEKAHWSLTDICDPCVDVPVKYLRVAVERLSAAPAPEGGAVPYGLNDLCWEVRRRYPAAFNGSDPIDAHPPSLENATDLFLAVCFAALATREEAPAEAGDEGPCTCCDDTGWTIQTEQACSCIAGDQYRAQPPAREDAQPVGGEHE